MKKVKKIFWIVGFLLIAAVLAIFLMGLDVSPNLTLAMALGGTALLLTNSVIDFARQPGLNKQNFLGKLLVWIYNMAWGFLAGYGIIDIVFKLVEGYEGSFATPIIMLSVGIVMFVVYIIIIARKDPEVQKEFAIMKTDERIIMNNYKAHYYAYYALLAAMVIFAAIIGLIPITGTAIIVSGIIGVCVLSLVAAGVLYSRYDKRQ
jgi:hypothetical protein